MRFCNKFILLIVFVVCFLCFFGGSIKNTSAQIQNRILFITYYVKGSSFLPPNNSQIDELLNTDGESINNYYKATTYGKINFSLAGIYGPYEISTDKSPSEHCLHIQDAYADIALYDAYAKGLKEDSFDTIVFLYSQPTGCGSGAKGYEYRNKHAIWVPIQYWQQNATEYSYIVNHELGHTLGLGHASLLQCNPLNSLFTSNLYTSCSYAQYGDEFDVMGSSWGAREFSGLQRFYLGVLPNNEVQTISASGTYNIQELHSLNSGTKLLAIPAPNSIHQDTYYVEYRRPIGTFDGTINSEIANGVQIRVGSKTPNPFADFLHNNTLLVNFPNTARNLIDGGELRDTYNQVAIKQVSHDNNQATVEIEYPQTVCLDSEIDYTLTPDTTTGSMDDPRTYTLSIENTNPITCGGKSLQIDISNSQSYRFTFEQTNFQVTVNPQQTENVEIRVTPIHSSGTWNGDYVIPITIKSLTTGQVLDKKNLTIRIQKLIKEAYFKLPYFLAKIGENFTNEIELIDINGNKYVMNDPTKFQWDTYNADIVSSSAHILTIKPKYVFNSMSVSAYVHVSPDEELYVQGKGYVLPSSVPNKGDADGDGLVNNADYDIWFANYGMFTSQGALKGDFNNSSGVDGLDYIIWVNTYSG